LNFFDANGLVGKDLAEIKTRKENLRRNIRRLVEKRMAPLETVRPA
jgi:hypothetical protein